MGLWAEIKADYRAVFDKDPAAKSALEVVLGYPGFHAVMIYRVANRLKKAGVPLLPRLISQVARLITGIEIHPSANIASGLFIDHGAGVVIGETTDIGSDCLLYQGVTLGGTGKETGKRHPTLGRGVVVGAGAKILGAIRIGDYAKIGANSVVLKPVPDYSIVVGVPGRIIKKKVMMVHEEGPVEVLDHVHMPDPVEEKFTELEARISGLERKIERFEGKKHAMKIYNTMTGRKETFEPLKQGEALMYACGITAYDVCHIGHARSAIVFDVMRQYLIYKGFKVTFVKNFTDIDDKIIKRSKEMGLAWDEVSKRFIDKYYEDMQRLGVRQADIEPRATEYIKEMIDIVSALIDKGYAYEIDGDVYFEVRKLEGYGKLSGRDIDDLRSGARVEVDERKRDPLDFALWKSSKEGEPWWESPWGRGRPGWHIECSAMSLKHLGETFDIHGGGADLIFPHHENELAQSEAYTGKQFVRYWVHNGFITVDKEKMSKSLGNFFTIEEILSKFEPEAVRLFLLQTHYRSPIEFSDLLIAEAEATVDRVYTGLGRFEDFLSSSSHKEKPGNTGALETVLSNFKARFEDAMDDDFNTASAIGAVFELLHESNKYLDDKPSGQKAASLIKGAKDSICEAGFVLRLFQRSVQEWYKAIMKVKGIGISDDDIEALVNKRKEARQNKDWAEADRIRKELESKGIVLEDKPGGTSWRINVDIRA